VPCEAPGEAGAGCEASSLATPPCEGQTPGDTVKIRVMAVEASQGGACDPRLEYLRSRLRRIVGYRSFRLVDEMRREVLWQDTQVFSLPEGRQLVLLPKGREAHQVLLQVRLLDGRRRLLDTIVRLRNRGEMVFAVEDDPRAQQALLVVLRAED
jgi:hypothetical protein